MKPLPLIQSCDGCGACCREQNAPPGYLAVMGGEWDDMEDIERVENLSPEARVALEDHLVRVERGDVQMGEPCCWYDAAMQQCRFYEERPAICRNFEIGGFGCRNWRREYQIR